MTTVPRKWVALVLLAAMLAGCDGEGITRPPPTTVQVVHAASSIPPFTFRRESRTEGNLDFGQGLRITFDSGPYDFHFDISPPGGGPEERLLELSTTVEPNLDYLFVMTDVGNGLEAIVVEKPKWGRVEPEITVVHAGPALGSFDIYLEPPGADLTVAMPVGSDLAYRDSGTVTRDEGDHNLYLTEPGNPANVLFRFTGFALSVDSYALVVTDGGGRGPALASMVLVTNTSAEYSYAGAPGELRIINAIVDRTDRDIAIDDDFSPPLYPAAAYGVVSPYAPVAPGGHEFTVAPVGNPGAPEHTAPFTISRGRAHTMLIGGDPGNAFELAFSTDDRRSITGAARMRIYTGTNLLEDVEIFIAAPGADLDMTIPVAFLPPVGSSVSLVLPPGDHELTIRDFDTETIVYGPAPITLEDGGYYGVLAVDAPGGSTADVVFFDDF